MSIKDLYERQRTSKLTAKKSIHEQGLDVESERRIASASYEAQLFTPPIDFTTASNFAIYSSAEQYYKDAFERIQSQYPYDGAYAEVQQFLNNSTALDLHVLENHYPRSTGYIHLSVTGWGNLSGSKIGNHGQPTDLEYIQIIGGPSTASAGVVSNTLHETFSIANLYQQSATITGSDFGTRDSNLKTDLSGGVSVEFWLKKDDYVTSAKTSREAIFDLWNGVNSGSTSATDATVAIDNDHYGRFTLELGYPGSTGASPWKLTLLSGTTGVSDQTLAAGAIASSDVVDGAWHHYAFTFQNTGSVLEARSYFDGALVASERFASGSDINEITGSLIANIGGLRHSPSGNTFNQFTTSSTTFEGGARLSASVDEFRFWKVKRNSKEIGRNWWTQVGGGTNSDVANTTLGVYYKFNEGIVGSASYDSTVLDYSGRVTNGNWIGYNNSVSRNTGSAMVSASVYGSASVEFEDPIIYDIHPDYEVIKDRLMATGSVWDIQNPAMIYNSYPEWITDEDGESGEELKKLTQIMANYFDLLHLQIKSLNTIGDVEYPSGSNKPVPWANRMLEGAGFVAPDIFVDANVLNEVAQRDEDRNFEEKIHHIKNMIYTNVYNNLMYIYKSKGTEKSFRNLIRCFGVDDELIKINLYSDNTTYKYRDSYRTASPRKFYADFNDTDRFDATIYQQTGSDGGGRTYITGSKASGSLGMTVEADIIFPDKLEISHEGFFPTPFTTASLFGLHTADPSTPTEFTYGGATHRDDSANFQVYAIRDLKESTNVSFMVSSSNPYPIPTLTSSLYYDVYKGQRWNFAVRVKPTKLEDQVTGSKGALLPASGTFDVEFFGTSMDADVVRHEFTVTGTMTNEVGKKFMASAKRLYVGAHRQNFTASLSDKDNVASDAWSDTRISSLRYWHMSLENDIIKAHARDPLNVGTMNFNRNAFTLQSDIQKIPIREIDTLALHWNFYNITGSDGGGDHLGTANSDDAGFYVYDASSGSSTLSSGVPVQKDERLGWFANLARVQHPGRGSFYLQQDSGSVKVEYVHSGRHNMPEIHNSNDMINILREDDVQFDKDSRPISHYFAVEKSMYQTISEEMLKMFGSIVEFNNIIGQPAERYRPQYKQLDLLRRLFFEKVQNDIDLDKWIDYYKWIDHALGLMLLELIPASARFSENIRNMVESHLLERSKYQTKFPTLEMKKDDPETGAISINKHLYNWKYGHHPLSDLQDENCSWWQLRAERQHQGSALSSSEGTVNSDRKMILSASTQVLERKWTTPFRLAMEESKEYHGGVNYRRSKKLGVVRQATQRHGRVNRPMWVPRNIMTIDDIEVDDFNDCRDVLNPNEKKYYTYSVVLQKNMDPDGPSYEKIKDYETVLKGDLVSPFTLVSSSVKTGYSNQLSSSFYYGLQITNLHADTYGPDNAVPMQGPFTEQWVGGHQSRHARLNSSSSVSDVYRTGLDSHKTRPEAWKILLGPTSASMAGMDSRGSLSGAIDPRFLGIVGPDYPFPADVIPCDGNPYPVTASQHAVFYREETAKRPLNIRNILQTTASLSSSMSGTTAHGRIGNYSKNYQIVQTHGRLVNPRFLRDHTGSLLPTAFANDLPSTTHPLTLIGVNAVAQGVGVVASNYPDKSSQRFIDGQSVLVNVTQNLPETAENVKTLPSRVKQDTVFVNRFSAPGGPEVMSRGYLDVVAEEYSVYNSLNYRNYSIRSSGSGEATNTIIKNTRTGRTGADASIGTSTAWEREGLQTKYSRHAGQFGIDSQHTRDRPEMDVTTEVVTASFHKINRNPLKVPVYTQDVYGSLSPYPVMDEPDVSNAPLDKLATKIQYDNLYVQHPIPRSDLQYTWITASYSSYAAFGHTTSSTDITFISSSNAASWLYPSSTRRVGFGSETEIHVSTNDSPAEANGFALFTPFVGMNVNINETVSASANSLGYPGNYHVRKYANIGDSDSENDDGTLLGAGSVTEGALLNQVKDPAPTSTLDAERQGTSAILNSLILHRQGPYGWPTWKQIRGAQHPIVRYWRRNNVVSVPDPENERRRLLSGSTIVANLAAESPQADYHFGMGQSPRGRTTSDPWGGGSNTQMVVTEPATPEFDPEHIAVPKPKVTAFAGYQGNDYNNFSESVVSTYTMPMATIVGDTVVNHAYGNNLAQFTTTEVANRYGALISDQDQGQMYNQLHKIYSDGATSFGTSYTERVYPSVNNAHSTKIRMRDNFNCAFWRSRRADRTLISGSTSQYGFQYRAALPNFDKLDTHWKLDTLSRWPLDARQDFATSIIEAGYKYTGSTVIATAFTVHATASGETEPCIQFYVNTDVGATAVMVSGNYGGELMLPLIQFSGNTSRIDTVAAAGVQGANDDSAPHYGAGKRMHFAHAMYARRQTVSTASAQIQPDTSMPAAVAETVWKITKNNDNGGGFLPADQIFGGTAEWQAPAQAEKYPFNASYEDWVNSLRLKAKDYSVIPEFRISEHLDRYMKLNGGNFLSDNAGQFTVSGSKISSSLDENFYKVYSNSDFLKHFEVVDYDHKDLDNGSGVKELSLKCKVYKKFMPYDGFYPALRTVQLANLFSASYRAEVQASYRDSADGLPTKSEAENIWASFLTPFFAPGILYNSIKAGLAVDYPIYTSDYTSYTYNNTLQNGTGGNPFGLAYPVDVGDSSAYAKRQQIQDTIKYALAKEKVSSAEYVASTGFPQVPGSTGSTQVQPPINLSNDAAAWPSSEGFLYSSFNKRIPFEALVEPEKYVTNTVIKWMEPHLSCSMDGVLSSGSTHGAIWNGEGDKRYKMAMNNFLAEVPEFFLEGGNFTSVTSKPESDANFGLAEIGKTYAAMVRLYKSRENSSLQQHGRRFNYGFPVPWNRNSKCTMTMYSRPMAFGPPWGIQSAIGYNIPFTPPYYDGEAWAILRFTGSDQGVGYDGSINPNKQYRKYTLDEILEATSVEYMRTGFSASYYHNGTGSAVGTQLSNNAWITGSCLSYFPENETNAMQVSASINLFRKASIKSVTYDAVTGAPITVEDDPQSNLNVWIMQPKFETPILNFGLKKPDGTGQWADINLPLYGSASTPAGMWHQYGYLPSGSEIGIFMQVTDVPQEFILSGTTGLGESHGELSVYTAKTGSTLSIGLGDPAEKSSAQIKRRFLGLQRTGSLAELVGFPTEPVRLGQPAQEKIVREGVVAVPFIEKQGERHFFEIKRETVDKAEALIAGGGQYALPDPAHEPGETIINMITNMKKFIFPPKMDFLTSRSITPFAMYIFEFEHTFTQQDLTDMWQNLPPKSIDKFEEAQNTITHQLTPTELMGLAGDISGQKMKTNLQWMVFKVKQKANKSYFSKIAGEETEEQASAGAFSTAIRAGFRYNFNLTTGDGVNSTQTVPTYSYNWPYDFFSIVELGRMETTITYGDIAIPGTTAISKLPLLGQVNPLTATPVQAGCVREGTIINTNRGNVKVEELVMDDLIYTYNNEKDAVGYYQLKDILSFIVPSWCRIKTKQGRELECSTTHKLITSVDYETIDAGEVIEGQALLVLDLETGDLDVDTIQDIEIFDEEVVVWNMTVEGAHTYFSDGILSHNIDRSDPLASGATAGMGYSATAGPGQRDLLTMTPSSRTVSSTPYSGMVPATAVSPGTATMGAPSATSAGGAFTIPGGGLTLPSTSYTMAPSSTGGGSTTSSGMGGMTMEGGGPSTYVLPDFSFYTKYSDSSTDNTTALELIS